jgi:hypothetical protein
MSSLLSLKSSDGNEVAVAVRLPDAISFDCFVPGHGVVRACLHPTSRDPSSAEVGEVNAWTEEGTLMDGIRLDESQTATAREQARQVLSFVTERLTHPADNEQAAVLHRIAEIAHGEVIAWEAWDGLPEAIQRGCNVRPRNPSRYTTMPSDEALAALVEVLVEAAQVSATATARELAKVSP